ncbi:MAG: DUF4382 domain-containing protein [Terracidiphilus sp.]|jgi:uncharacterized protein DUF4382
MIRNSLPFLLAPALFAFLLTGCSSSNKTGICACPAPLSGAVSLSMTDDPPAGVSVLFFQVSLTNATLAPTTGSPVSLLSNNTPIQIDVTQLQGVSAFLNTTGVTAGTYNSLSLTFANPQLVIYNQSDASLGSSCAVGAICTLTPTFDSNSSTQTFTSSPFPVTVSMASPLGFLIDFHLNTVIQSDLSVNLAATNGVTVSELPPAPTAAQFGFVTGTVTEVVPSNGEIELALPWGGSLFVDATSSTTFNNFPSSACSTPSIACVQQGQIVQVQISSNVADGLPTVSQVNYVQLASAQTVEGTIVRIPPLPLPAGETIIDLILHQNPSASTSSPIGAMASVAVWSPGSGSSTPTTFSIDNSGFTIPSGLTFGQSTLTVGQTVKVTVTPGTLTTTGAGPGPSAWGPPPSISFTASAVELEPSQVTGAITAIDSSTTSFTLGVGAGPFFAPWPLPNATGFSFNVLTTGQTAYAGFNPDNFSGLATNDFVSVHGWLFPPATTGPPTIVAQSVLLRPSAVF